MARAPRGRAPLGIPVSGGHPAPAPHPAGPHVGRSPRPAVRLAETPCPVATQPLGPRPAEAPVRRPPRPAVCPPRGPSAATAPAAGRRNPALLSLLRSCLRGPAQAQPLLLPLSCGWRLGRRFLSDSNNSAVTRMRGSRRPIDPLPPPSVGLSGRPGGDGGRLRGQGQLLHLQTPLPAGGTGFPVTFSLSSRSTCLGACVGFPSSHILREWGGEPHCSRTVTPKTRVILPPCWNLLHCLAGRSEFLWETWTPCQCWVPGQPPRGHTSMHAGSGSPRKSGRKYKFQRTSGVGWPKLRGDPGGLADLLVRPRAAQALLCVAASPWSS